METLESTTVPTIHSNLIQWCERVLAAKEALVLAGQIEELRRQHERATEALAAVQAEHGATLAQHSRELAEVAARAAAALAEQREAYNTLSLELDAIRARVETERGVLTALAEQKNRIRAELSVLMK